MTLVNSEVKTILPPDVLAVIEKGGPIIWYDYIDMDGRIWRTTPQGRERVHPPPPNPTRAMVVRMMTRALGKKVPTDYSKMLVKDLVHELRKRGLQVSGTKAVLIQRLQENDADNELYHR